MLAYAYQIQVRETEDSDWLNYDMMVSPPGHAPRTLLNVVKKGSENLVRMYRIKQGQEFLIKSLQGFNTAFFKVEGSMDITFVDRVLTIPEDMIR